MNRAFTKTEALFVTLVAFLVIVIIPVLNAQGLLQNLYISIWGKYLCYAVLAISVDLLWGYTGLLSLGQSLFFSLGGYMFGMYLMLVAGPFGSYAQSGRNPNGVPDFLFFLGHTVLPSFWKPFSSFGFSLFMVVALPGLLAMGFGYLAFRSRIKGVYFSILTQALTYAASVMFLRNDMLLGGNNGFTDFRYILGFDTRNVVTQRWLYILSAVLLLLVYVLCKWLTATKFGLIQRAVRDSETRVLFSGYAAANYKLFVFVLSAVIAGLGGALYVPQAGIINPNEMMTEKSLEAVVWCAVGGRGTLVGPIVGAIGVNALKSWATRACPDLWLIIMGSLFMVMVIFVPNGIVGIPTQIKAFLKKWKDHGEPPAPGATPEEPAPAAAPVLSAPAGTAAL